MKYIKSYSEKEKINESLIVMGIAIFAVISRLISIFLSYSLKNRISKSLKQEISISDEIEKIIGKKIQIYSYNRSGKMKKYPPMGATNIVIFDEKLHKLLTDKELLACILHEVSHIQTNDVLKRKLLETFFYIPVIFLNGWLFFILMSFMRMIFCSMYSRSTEYKSDLYTKQYGYEEDFLTGLIKLEKEYKYRSIKILTREIEEVQSNFNKLKELFSQHPKLYDRIKNIYGKSEPKEFLNMIDSENKINSDDIEDIKDTEEDIIRIMSERQKELDKLDNTIKNRKPFVPSRGWKAGK